MAPAECKPRWHKLQYFGCFGPEEKEHRYFPLLFVPTPEAIPLRPPLGSTAWKMIKAKHVKALDELERVNVVSGMGREIP